MSRACEQCGQDTDRLGTGLEVELFIEDRSFGFSPAFCSWEHAATWFAQPPPEFDSWRQLKRRPTETPRRPTKELVAIWFVVALLVTLIILAVVVLGASLN